MTFVIWLCYVAFVVYGSLVPLDFKAMPLDQAWVIFQHAPMLKLGVESRADWIANGVLYVPIGFLTAHLLLQRFGSKQSIFAFFLAILFSIALALGVEFSQIFFPPRTVSLNDLLAEFIGSLLGVMLATRYTEWFKSVLHALFENPQRLVPYLAEAYLFSYVAFSLFPYDVLLSTTEIAQKLQSNNWGWLLAQDSPGSFIVLLKSAAEVVLTLPFGLYLGYRSTKRPATFGQAALLGLLLGSFVEIAQFFIATGVSQGLSILTRVVGVCAGLLLWRQRANWSPEKITAFLQRHAVLLGSGYLLLLPLANGWFARPWRGLDHASAQLHELRFLPFYYHYYTTETNALFSLASVCFMYMPIGLLTWVNRGTPVRALWLAAIAALIIETGKLFQEGTHPDPTNIILGALASWAAAKMTNVLTEASRATSSALPTAEKLFPSPRRSVNGVAETQPATPSKYRAYALGLPLLAFVAYRAATFPVLPELLCLLLTACAVAVWYRPALIVFILPLALPVLDLAPWSGRFFLDEFDLLVLVCLAIGYIRTQPAHCQRSLDTILKLSLVLIAASYAISALRGLLPWQMPDANAFTNYFSAFNALRIGKGALFAFLIFKLLRRIAAPNQEISRLLALGMVGGLALTVAVVLWERITFGAFFDFASEYRVTGPISAMHTGGAYIECFLAVATPFLMLLIVQTQSVWNRLLGLSLLLATTYALMVTYSRNGYAAFFIAFVVFLIFVALKRGQSWRRRILVATIALTVLAVALPVFTGHFAQKRLDNVSSDFSVRRAHWEDTLSMRSTSWTTSLLGMGLGRYPESHYLFSNEPGRTGTYLLRNEEGNTYLRLSSGDPMYVEQVVQIQPRRTYSLKLNIRSASSLEKIGVSICEKWVLTSFRCVWKSLSVDSPDGTWRNLEASINTGELGDYPWFANRPIKLALHYSSRKFSNYRCGQYPS